jgi:SAM-dependent methyltransferase
LSDGPLLDAFRHRLYATYATTHEGDADPGSVAVTFQRDILPHLPRDTSVDVLDLGCGQGQLVRQLIFHKFVRARGIDISPEQVEKAHASGIESVSLGDYRGALDAGAVDVVVATDFFEHLTRFELLDAVDRVKRGLRPGGLLIMRVPNAVSPFGGNFRYGDLTHETAFTARSLRQLGAAAGFHTIDVYPCRPPVHGVKSGLRAGLWIIIAAMMKAALIAETGQVRGHLVTQNIVGVMRTS